MFDIIFRYHEFEKFLFSNGVQDTTEKLKMEKEHFSYCEIYESLEFIKLCSAPLFLKVSLLKILFNDKGEFISLFDRLLSLYCFSEFDSLRELHSFMSSRPHKNKKFWNDELFCLSSQIKTRIVEKTSEDLKILKTLTVKNNSSDIPTSPRRVVICVGYITANLKSTHLHFVKNRVSALQSRGFHVDILFTGEHCFNYPGANWYCYDEKYIDFHSQYWLSVTGNYPNFVLANDKANIFYKFVILLKSIEPDVVLFLGDLTPRESDFFRAISFISYPVGYLPCQIKFMPKTYNDAILTGLGGKDFCKKQLIDNEKILYVPEPFEIRGDNSEFTDSLDCFNGRVMVTPLTQNRIISVLKKIKEEDLSSLNKLFDKHSDLNWLLVGVDSDSFNKLTSEIEFFRELRANSRLFSIESTKQLRGLFRRCAIFFSPPGMIGGAGGAYMAMYEGVPVVSHYISDCASKAHSELVFSSGEDMKEIIDKLLSSDDYYKSVTLKQMKELQQATPSSVGMAMERAIVQLFNFGSVRLNKG